MSMVRKNRYFKKDAYVCGIRDRAGVKKSFMRMKKVRRTDREDEERHMVRF